MDTPASASTSTPTQIQTQPQKPIPSSVGFLMALGWIYLLLSVVVGIMYAMGEKRGELVGIAISVQGLVLGTLMIVVSHAAQWAWDARAAIMPAAPKSGQTIPKDATPGTLWSCPNCKKQQPSWSNACECGYRRPEFHPYDPA
jgi:hypothetical protein